MVRPQEQQGHLEALVPLTVLPAPVVGGIVQHDDGILSPVDILLSEDCSELEDEVEEGPGVSVPQIEGVEELTPAAHCGDDVHIVESVGAEVGPPDPGKPPTLLAGVSDVDDRLVYVDDSLTLGEQLQELGGGQLPPELVVAQVLAGVHPCHCLVGDPDDLLQVAAEQGPGDSEAADFLQVESNLPRAERLLLLDNEPLHLSSGPLVDLAVARLPAPPRVARGTLPQELSQVVDGDLEPLGELDDWDLVLEVELLDLGVDLLSLFLLNSLPLQLSPLSPWDKLELEHLLGGV